MLSLRELGVALLLVLPGQEPQRPPAGPGPTGITVEGVGEARLAADLLEYRAMLVKGGASPGEAMVEYGRETARMPKVLDQLGLKGLEVELRGVVLTSLNDEQFKQRQRQAMSYGNPVPNKCEVKDFVTVRVPLAGVEAKDAQSLAVAVLDAAMQLGLEDPEVRRQAYDPYGRAIPSEAPDNWVPGLSFALRDTKKLYADAVKAAFDDAKARAEVQAMAAGAKLGRVLGVETVAGARVEAGRMRELQHRVVLRVRYELAEK